MSITFIVIIIIVFGISIILAGCWLFLIRYVLRSSEQRNTTDWSDIPDFDLGHQGNGPHQGDNVLLYSLLTHEDQATYRRLVKTLRWREQVEKYNELDKSNPYSETSYTPHLLYYFIRGRFFHYDQKRTKRILNFLKDMQLKYDCNSVDPTHFPGSERWQ